MKKNIKKVLILISILFFGVLSQTHRSLAIENIATSMFVAPMLERVDLIPGESYYGKIKIASAATAQKPLKYKIEIGSYNRIKDANSNDDYGSTDIETRTSYNQIMDWIVLTKDSGVIEPNSSDSVSYVINVPSDAPAGAQYASIIVINDTSESEGTNNTSITNKYQIASAIIANVYGNSVKKGTVTNNSVPSFLTKNTLEAVSMVKNDGNVHTDAEYILQVWPLFNNEEICTNEENPETSLVLPETERYHTQSCNLPPVGIFRAKQTVKIFEEESIVEKIVIVCPIWLLFIIIFVIFALIFYFITRAKARKKASQKTSRS